MFVIKSDNAKKTYLKIVKIQDHETQVEIVSQRENLASINGKIVELAVKNIIEGNAIKNKEALANPEILEEYKQIKELYEFKKS